MCSSVELDTSGAFNWAKQLGGSHALDANNISMDDSGNVYTTGNFDGTADFVPGVLIYNITSTISYGAFLLKLEPEITG